MGSRGPAPKPTALKQRQGNPGKRALNHNEPQPERAPAAMRAPAHLSGEALREWKRLVKILTAAGLLTKADRGILTAYCQAWSMAVTAQEALDRTGPVIKTSNGNLIQNPYLAVLNRAMDQILVYGRELGLSPSSRSRLSVQPDAPPVSVADRLFALVKAGARAPDDER